MTELRRTTPAVAGLHQKPPEAMTRQELEDEVTWLREELGLAHDLWDFERVRAVVGYPLACRLALLLYRSTRPLNSTFIQERLPAAHGRERTWDNIPVHVWRLRQKLGAGIVRSVRGHGYELTEEGREVMARLLYKEPPLTAKPER